MGELAINCPICDERFMWRQREPERRCLKCRGKYMLMVEKGGIIQAVLVSTFVDQETFRKKIAQIYYKGGDFPISKVKHEYWVEKKNGDWAKSENGVDGAVPVTVGYLR